MKIIWPTLFALWLMGCDSSATDQDGGLFDLGADLHDGAAAACEEPRELACLDELILDLALHDDKISNGQVITNAAGSEWLTVVDATAGGFGQEQNNPWVYVRFEEEGAVRVDIDDETALESMNWHVAARRFVIRTNGGNSGPACVKAAAVPHMGYVAINEVPDDVTFTEDDFYTEACAMIDDDSGLPGSPRTALGNWWLYEGCVKTTLIPFLIQLDGERVIKLLVESYYEEGQQECNSTSVPGTNGGVFTWRWRFLD
jgi:hypothetical protein